jgi:hypothetical protein
LRFIGQVNAYKPRYYYWEGYDMVRKLTLVGMLVVAGRGSVAQLFMAVVISFASFSLQVKLVRVLTCPSFSAAMINSASAAVR